MSLLGIAYGSDSDGDGDGSGSDQGPGSVRQMFARPGCDSVGGVTGGLVAYDVPDEDDPSEVCSRCHRVLSVPTTSWCRPGCGCGQQAAKIGAHCRFWRKRQCPSGGGGGGGHRQTLFH
jgi:hypothetical protein